MGRGIALAFACAGRRIALIDVKQRNPSDVERLRAEAMADMQRQLEALAEIGVLRGTGVSAILARIDFCGRAAASGHLTHADLLFEAVPEVIEAKEGALAFASEWLKDDTVVASTSSTILSTALSGLVRGPQRFLNAHWLNPAHLMPLVELSPHPDTDPRVTQWLRETLEGIGKVTVLCGASPGYIVPRLQTLIMNEAARMIEQGIATAEDIDRATRYGFGIRYAAMGVVEFIDVGGNDILYYASRYLSEAFDDARYASPDIVGRYMAQGRNGLRNGRGFHEWAGTDVDEYQRQRTARLVALLRLVDRMPVVKS